MLENYDVIAPNRAVYAKAETWNEAIDKAVELSLRWGALFRVRRLEEAHIPFQRERQKVLDTSLEYIELSRKYPKALVAAKAKIRFEAAKRKLDNCNKAFSELQTGDLHERQVLSHPVKAYRTDS